MTKLAQPEQGHAHWLTAVDGRTLGQVAYEAYLAAASETVYSRGGATAAGGTWGSQPLDARIWWQKAAQAVAEAALHLGAGATRFQIEGINRARLACALPPLPAPFPELRPSLADLSLVAAQDTARPAHQHYWQDAGWARDMPGLLVLYCAPCGEVRFVDAQRKRITQTQPTAAQTAPAGDPAPLGPAALAARLAYLRSAPTEETPEEERLIYRAEGPPARLSLEERVGGPPPSRPQPGPR